MIALSTCGGGGSVGVSPYHRDLYLQNLSNPSALRFTPDGRLFFTELHTGKIRVVVNGTLLPAAFAHIDVSTGTEQGLLGLAVDPDFATNHYLYVFYTLPNQTVQRIDRFTDVNNLGTDQTTIVDNLPANVRHNGGRIEFGPDGDLYVTLGDNNDAANAQEPQLLPGKVLRYNSDGSIPADNPFPGSPVYALGLRNPFGLAFYPGTGTAYVSDNGPSCDDEIDRIVPAGNYGWRPSQACGDADPDYRQPTQRFTSIIVPTGIAFYTGTAFPQLHDDLLLTSYADGFLRRFRIDDIGNGIVLQQEIIFHALDHPTDVTVGPDGFIYIAEQAGISRIAPGPQ